MSGAVAGERDATAAEVLAAFEGRERIGLSALKRALGHLRTRAAMLELMRAGKVRRVPGGSPIAYELVRG